MSRGQILRKAGDALLALLVPKNAAGKVDTTQMALRYAPDVLYSGLTSAMLPPGATGGERFGAGAEDLGISLLGSVLGQTAGAGAARAMGKKLGSDAGNLAVTLGDMGVQAPLRCLHRVLFWKTPTKGLIKRIRPRKLRSLRLSRKCKNNRLIKSC